MPHLQIVNSVQHNRRALCNLINYVARPDKCRCRLSGVTNMWMQSRDLVQNLEEYHDALWEYHCKGIERYALHLIVRFAPSESKYLDPQKILELGYYIAETAFPNQICYFGVHDHSCYSTMPKQTYFHIDMIVFSVGVTNGVMYSVSMQGGYRILYSLAAYMKKYVPENEIGNPIVFVGNKPSNKNHVIQEMEL